MPIRTHGQPVKYVTAFEFSYIVVFPCGVADEVGNCSQPRSTLTLLVELRRKSERLEKVFLVGQHVADLKARRHRTSTASRSGSRFRNQGRGTWPR